MDSIITWLARSLHVAGAAVWIGSYAVLVVAIVPALAGAWSSDTVRRLTLATLRLASGAGTLTIVAGLVLIARSRGYESLVTGGEWGLNIISGAVLAVVLMGLGDGALRPALRSTDAAMPPRLRRLAVTGLVLSLLALAIMTRALYARS
jgi:hypothetical protein